MSKTRFGKCIVLLCMGVVAACTSGTDGGTTGNTEMNLFIGDADSPNEAFDADFVDYRLTCPNNSLALTPIPPRDPVGSFDNSVDISGQFELLADRDSGGPPLWQALWDLPPTVPGGDCRITVSVSDEDEIVCTATADFAVEIDELTKVDLVIVCSLSVDLPSGMADIDGTFDFVTGNLCPELYTLNAIQSQQQDPDNPQFEIILQSRAKDPDGSCGANCDPETCDNSNPPVCERPASPGLSTRKYVAVGSVGSITRPNADDSIYMCDPAVGGFQTVCVDAKDGDDDCTKTICIDVECPGGNPCEGGQDCATGGNADCVGTGQTCDTTTDTCTPVACDAVPNTDCWTQGVCQPSTFPACTENIQFPEETDCTTAGGPSSECNAAGECVLAGGACNDVSQCGAAPSNPCKVNACIANLCVVIDGNESNTCSPNESGVATSPGTCVAGVCTCNAAAGCECTGAADCGATGNDCQQIACDVAAGTCGDPVDAANCVTSCNDGAGVCIGGACNENTPGGETYTLGGDFRAFNGLLPPDIDLCTNPDMEFPAIPGSSMPSPSDIGTQCVSVPGVGGSLTFKDQGGGSYDIVGSLDLSFTIDAVIPQPLAQVLIVTSSSTTYAGTASGAVADGQYLTPLPAVTPLDPRDETLNMSAGTPCNCEAIRDPDGQIASNADGTPAFVACGPDDTAEGTERCETNGRLCVKTQIGEFFPGACATGTSLCSAAAQDFVGDDCGCPNGLCVVGGEACQAPATIPPANTVPNPLAGIVCGAGFPCVVTSDCPAFAQGQTCGVNVANQCDPLPSGKACTADGGNPCDKSTDCPLNSLGQTCQFTGDPTTNPGVCGPLYGPAAEVAGFCGNPTQTCTGLVCDPVGDPGAGAACGQPFGQTCIGSKCQEVDLSNALCPIANLAAGVNYTPLPNDPLERSWGALLFTTDNTTCGLDMVMDRDQEGNGGPTNSSGWFVSNPPDLASDGTQFVGMTGAQQ